MSGPSASERCEPNMTPLLDLVLQLVMFFMLCANFVMEQVNESVKLPTAIEAKALDRNQQNYVILNVGEQGQVLLDKTGSQVLSGRIQVRNHMRNLLDQDKARTKPALWEQGKGRSVVILRAHKNCTYKMVHEVLAGCRDAGYSDIQLRAIKTAPGA